MPPSFGTIVPLSDEYLVGPNPEPSADTLLTYQPPLPTNLRGVDGETVFLACPPEGLAGPLVVHAWDEPVPGRAVIEEIARLKMPDLNTESLESAIKTVAGTARSMGLDVVG